MLLPERRGPGNKKNLKRKVERRFRKLRSVTNMFFEKNMLFHSHKCMFLLEADMYIFTLYFPLLAAGLQASSVAIKDGAFDRLGQMHARDAADKATPHEAAGKATQEEQAGC